MARTRARRGLALAAAVLFIGALVLPGYAEAHSGDYLHYDKNDNVGEKMYKKGVRGVVNFSLALVEIPIAFFEEEEESDPWSGFWMGAFTRGGTNTLTRISAGIFEFLSAPLPMPKNYEPLMDPETRLSSD